MVKYHTKEFASGGGKGAPRTPRWKLFQLTGQKREWRRPFNSVLFSIVSSMNQVCKGRHRLEMLQGGSWGHHSKGNGEPPKAVFCTNVE